MVITMNHTGFVVQSIERSLLFYRDTLGLEEAGRFDAKSSTTSTVVGYDDAHLKGVLLVGADGHYLELLEYINPRSDERGSNEQYKRAVVGAAHLAFLVDDAEAVLDRLVENGGTKLNPVVDTKPGVKACYLQDPDGNWIELLEDKEHSRQQFKIRQNTSMF